MTLVDIDHPSMRPRKRPGPDRVDHIKNEKRDYKGIPGAAAFLAKERAKMKKGDGLKFTSFGTASELIAAHKERKEKYRAVAEKMRDPRHDSRKSRINKLYKG